MQRDDYKKLDAGGRINSLTEFFSLVTLATVLES